MKEVTYKVEYRLVSDLTPWKENPRYIEEEDLDRLVESIKNLPHYFEARPVLLSDRCGKLLVIGGNQRMKAAKKLGLTEVPTILFHCKTEEEEIEIANRDNVCNGKWKQNKLREMAEKWGEAKLKSWGVPLEGWKTKPAPEIKSAKPTPFIVTVECDTFEQQQELFERLINEGFPCRVSKN